MIFSPGSTKAVWATDQEPMKGHAEKQACSLIPVVQDLASLLGFVNPHYFPKMAEKPLVAQGWQSWTQRSHGFQGALLKFCNQKIYILSLIQVYCWYKWGEPLLTSEKLPWKKDHSCDAFHVPNQNICNLSMGNELLTDNWWTKNHPCKIFSA